MLRAILIVLDGCGAGEAPDASAFGDNDHPATIRHVWESAGPLDLPNLASCGFLSACKVDADFGSLGNGLKAKFGRLRELSMGKDSVTGHWEMMGIVTDVPFPTYPGGFPESLVGKFEHRIGVEVLANKAASGTQVIQEFGAEHMATGKPILYTSADSVFQIACHQEVVPLDRLYEICRIAREVCVEPDNVERVIARPFVGSASSGFTRTEHRKDFPLTPPTNLLDRIGDVYGVGVVPELFAGRGFRPSVRTQSNAEHEKSLFAALASDARLIFANFEDFDMLFGHRNDPAGFAGALVRFDATLGRVLEALTPGDLLVLTADHGNDPTTPSTDHSREYVPFCVIGHAVEPGEMGDQDGMTRIGDEIARHLSISSGGFKPS